MQTFAFSSIFIAQTFALGYTKTTKKAIDYILCERHSRIGDIKYDKLAFKAL